VKRTYRRRTFAQVTAAETDRCLREVVGFINAHAAKLKAFGQSDEAAPLTAAAGMIMAGFAEKEGKG
jgi:hypothetical protein